MILHVQTLYTEVASNTLGPRAQKARYFGYTDASFSTRTVQPAEHGILGPLISAEVSRHLPVWSGEMYDPSRATGSADGSPF